MSEKVGLKKRVKCVSSEEEKKKTTGQQKATT
jgi:hypothetical protein